MELSSKSYTLKKLKLKKSVIPNLEIFNCKDFFKKKDQILKKIKLKFKNNKVVIRSSFSNEDTSNFSNAGKYKSFLNVNPSDKQTLESKIVQVIKSKKKISYRDTFFIQKMIENVEFSGVVLTRDLRTHSKCLNINYFDGNKTDIVTAGKVGSKNIIFFENEKYKIPKKFRKLKESINEIIKLFKSIDLDIEFAVDKKKQINILQVRNLIIPKNKIKSENSKDIFKNLEKKLNKLKQKHYGLLGNTTYFGNMPDWNPAEIIGTKPRPLALSIYQELITDHIWSQNRVKYGYKDLSQFHLMTTFYGTPYIDVRIDFNSWIPQDLKDDTAKKIIKHYLQKFRKGKSIQDKVEFEILFTCATFKTLSNLKKEFKKILNIKELEKFYNSLKKINKKAIVEKRNDINLISELESRQNIIKKSKLYEIDKIYWLIEDCKKFGTLPFAGLARCGFIAVELLNSMEENNIITKENKIEFLKNIETITIKMKNDLNHLTKKKFLQKYGHLRPGTYDINSGNYRDNFNLYFGNFNKKKKKKRIISKKISFNKKDIKTLGIYKNKDQLLKFIKESIQYREYSKFIFSKSIDLIFENLNKFGGKYGISTDDLSYLKIDNILQMYFNLSKKKTVPWLKKYILENKQEYFMNKNIILPDVIKSGKDLFIQEQFTEKLNFISNKTISDKIYIFNKNKIMKKYEGIICIENADPGYDFLFEKNIKGLITKYGGLNSHMAIRCAELNLPALIGVGEKNFKNICNHNYMKLNCDQNTIELIN